MQSTLELPVKNKS